MKKIKQIIKINLLKYTIKYVGRSKILETVLNSSEKESLKHINNGFLYDVGWWESWSTKSPVDIKRKPLPWVTYSFINFIENRLSKDMVLFEFGSGNSTLYYSSKVKEVHTVENDKDWYNKISKILPKNVTINNIELVYGGDYSKASSLTNSKYDVIIVDGRDRVNCMINAVKSLKSNGVIILDDSEREAYKEGVLKLNSLGFKKLDFWGISPGFISYNKCTSIFYTVDNILEI